MSQETKLLTKQARIQHWTEIIHDRCRSGKRVEEYCRDNNITRDQYYYWLREVREYAVSTQINPIVEIKPAAGTDIMDSTVTYAGAAPVAGSGSLSIRIGDAIIEVTNGTSMQLLKNVLGVVRDA